jgi:phosphoribosyl 1,2-cyclic phosphodiesterase
MGSEKKRILIADSSEKLCSTLTSSPLAQMYTIETAKTGPEALAKISSFQPDLILAELMLPEIHGIEVLKKVREGEKSRSVGVIITSSHAMIQNYHAAVKGGADYFLEKPFQTEFFFSLAACFFSGQLHPDPFSGIESSSLEGSHCYVPKMHVYDSYIKFWGTRGSNPVSGNDYIRYGGNTVCLELRHGNDLVIIDAGTGIRPLGNSLMDVKNIHLFIGHTHWDHILGFPFFAPIYNSDCHICIWAPIGFEKTTRELFTEMLAYAYFPVRLDDIQAKISFRDLRDGQSVSIGKIQIHNHYAFHPGATLCFKIQFGDKTIGYASDNEMLMGYHGNPSGLGRDHPLLAPYDSLIKFYQGCDLLVHEAQYFPAEYQKKVGWGHSSLSNAAALMQHCKPKEWMITHHDPQNSDEDILNKLQMAKDIMEECKIPCSVRMAFDGLVLPI